MFETTTVMQQRENHDVRFRHVVDETEWLYKDFSDILVTALCDDVTSLAQSAEGIRSFQDPLQEAEGTID